MKKIILSVLAATTMMSPIAIEAASAQVQRSTTTVRERPNGRTVVTQRTVTRDNGYRNWRKGQRFDRRYARNYQRIDNWRSYRSRRLYQPPRGYYWARSGNDAVLIAATSGIIGAVLAGAFR